MERFGCTLGIARGTVSLDVLVALTILQILVLLGGVGQLSRILNCLPKQVNRRWCLDSEPLAQVGGLTGAGAGRFAGVDGGGAALEDPGHNDVGWAPAFLYNPEELLALKGGALTPPEGIPQGLRMTFPHNPKQEEIKKPNPYAWWDWEKRRDVCKRRRGKRWRRRNQEQQVESAWGGGSPVLSEATQTDEARYPPTILKVSSVAHPLSFCRFPAISPTPLKEAQSADRPDFTSPFDADNVDLLESWEACSSSSQDFGRPHHVMCCSDCRPCSGRVSISVRPPRRDIDCPDWNLVYASDSSVESGSDGDGLYCPNCSLLRMECRIFQGAVKQGREQLPPDVYCENLVEDFQRWRRHRFRRVGREWSPKCYQGWREHLYRHRPWATRK